MVMTPFQQLVQNRKSIRYYSEAAVEREKILACLESARRAPSAENAQPWRFLIIDDPELKTKFCEAAFSGIYSMCRFASRAPVIVVILARPEFRAHRLGKRIQGVQFYLLDLGIAGEHFVLQAEELGLGTCWIGWFHRRKVKKALDVPRKYKIVALLSVGYPEKRPSSERPRKPLEKIAWFNHIGD